MSKDSDFANLPLRVVLTGYRACGKTTVGRELAARLDWEFIDTDAVIQERHGEIAAMVARHGWERFRDIEAKLLVELAGVEKKVIATGGGAITHEAAWEKLRHGALVVWLAADPETVRARLAADPASSAQRPSLSGRSATDEIEEVMAGREPLYRKGSDIRIDASLPVKQVINEIERALTVRSDQGE